MSQQVRWLHALVFCLAISGCQQDVETGEPESSHADGNVAGTPADADHGMRGDWIVLQGLSSPSQTSPEVDLKMTIDDHSLLLLAPGMSHLPLATIERFDTSSTPKQVDLRYANGETQLGIYELDGSRLRIYLSNVNVERATNFEEPPEGTLFLLERAP